MADAFIGEIRAFPYTYNPVGWAYCNGQQMSVSQFTALYAVIGTGWGPYTQTAFSLPNLLNQALPGYGQGTGTSAAGLSTYNMAQTMGANAVTITNSQVPTHNHSFNVGMDTNSGFPYMTAAATAGVSQMSRVVKPAAGTMAQFAALNYTSDQPDTTLSPAAVAPALGGANGLAAAHENRQPFQGMRFCINLDGTFPTRN
ncbi:phage tail protein [Azospirillum sp. CT11-132]|uniref:phage tail protein n=1 Tax=Azospirillum sp. CT11-132 TaxID=3396317 RepID=UPI0039A4EB42